ncbi:Os10g0363400 [Oryza sativa Japonica Group]|nr:Os10g0363400 [Oryza sativa Japonica Group]
MGRVLTGEVIDRQRQRWKSDVVDGTRISDCPPASRPRPCSRSSSGQDPVAQEVEVGEGGGAHWMGQEGLETELLEVRSTGAPTWASGGGAQDGGIGDAREGRVRRQRRVGRWGGVGTHAGRGGGAGDARGVKEKRRRRSIWRRHVRRVRLRSVFVSLSTRRGV